MNDSHGAWMCPIFCWKRRIKNGPPQYLAFPVIVLRMMYCKDWGCLLSLWTYKKPPDLLQFFAPLPEEQSGLLAQAQVKGSLEQFSLFADLDEKHFAVNGKFTNINVAPSAAMPGIENLTGQLKGSDQQGSVDLATKDARIETSGLFREALRITTTQRHDSLAANTGRLDRIQSNHCVGFPRFKDQKQIEFTYSKNGRT